MAKVIIGIHGLGNKPPKKVLENWWNLAMIEGLEKLGKPVKPFQFELIYWADVMYPKPLDVNISNKDDAFYLGEKYIPSPENFVEESHPKRKKILDYLTKQLDSLFLNDDFSLNYKFLTDTILHRYFKDLDSYYKEKCKIDNSEECNAKEIIRTRIAEVIKKYKKDEILILGHSMGSILAYDVLAFILKDIKIDTLLTIGSPLGFPIVKGKIAAEQKLNHLFTKHLRTPKSVKRNWLNFSDLEDKVAFNYKLSDDFQENIYNVKPVDFIVDNDYEYLGEKNPHKSFGYLRAPQFSEKLYEFLELKKLNIWFLIWKKITGLINKITAQLTFLWSKLF